jgi:hypothetical protein
MWSLSIKDLILLVANYGFESDRYLKKISYV